MMAIVHVERGGCEFSSIFEILTGMLTNKLINDGAVKIKP